LNLDLKLSAHKCHSVLSAASYEDELVEFGPLGVSFHDDSRPSTSSHALTSAFPSPFSLQLFHHFLNYTSRILITMGNIGPNPLLTICASARLLDTACAGSAALRMSILSASTAHLISEAGERSSSSGNSSWIAGWTSLKKSLQGLGEMFRKAAVANIVLAENDGTDQCERWLSYVRHRSDTDTKLTV
jgi:hypothetical protein